MRYIGKPFFHSYGYGVKQPVNKEEIKHSQNANLLMNSALLKETFLQKTKKKSTKESSMEKAGQKQASNQFISKLLNEFPTKQSFLHSEKIIQRGSLHVPADKFQEYGTIGRNPSPQPYPRLPSLGKKTLPRGISEDKKGGVNSYLQRERFKRYLDSSNKMTWESMERLNKDDLKELTKAEFDPNIFLDPQTEEDKKYLEQLGVITTPQKPEKTNFLQVAEIQGRPRSRSPRVDHINRPLTELNEDKKRTAMRHIPMTPTTKSPLHGTLPTTNAASRVTTTHQGFAGRVAQNSRSKSRNKNERQRARELSVENQAKRHQQLIQMLKHKIN